MGCQAFPVTDSLAANISRELGFGASRRSTDGDPSHKRATTPPQSTLTQASLRMLAQSLVPYYIDGSPFRRQRRATRSQWLGQRGLSRHAAVARFCSPSEHPSFLPTNPILTRLALRNDRVMTFQTLCFKWLYSIVL